MSRVIGDFDFLINGTFSHADGYREHSESDYTQINGNFGYRFSPNVETRFYFGVYDTWQQLPGTLTLSDTLNNPQALDDALIAGYGTNGFGANQARDVKNERISNKTTIVTDFGRIDARQLVHSQLPLSPGLRRHRAERRNLGLRAEAHQDLRHRGPSR